MQDWSTMQEDPHLDSRVLYYLSYVTPSLFHCGVWLVVCDSGLTIVWYVFLLSWLIAKINVTEWDIGSRCWRHGIPFRKHYNADIHVHCHKSGPVFFVWPQLVAWEKSLNHLLHISMYAMWVTGHCGRSWVRTHGWIKPMTYKIDTSFFVARCSVLLG